MSGPRRRIHVDIVADLTCGRHEGSADIVADFSRYNRIECAISQFKNSGAR